MPGTSAIARAVEAIFDLIDPAAYYSRPIALRNPIVFYEGHLPAFSVIAFLRRGLGLPPVDARLEQLFERGNRSRIREGRRAAQRRIDGVAVARRGPRLRARLRRGRARAMASLAMPGHARGIEGLYTALEHEAMHQETLLYMWHRLPYEQKIAPASQETRRPGGINSEENQMAPDLRTPVSKCRLVLRRWAPLEVRTVFAWDNEFDAHDVHVPAFEIDTLPVTNAQFLEFVERGWIQQPRAVE